MACSKCNKTTPCNRCKDKCKDNGCAPIVYPKCFVIDKTYSCLGLTPGKTGEDLLSVLNTACAVWGGGNLTFNNGLTRTGNLVQLGGALVKDTAITSTTQSFSVQNTVSPTILQGVSVDPNGNGVGIPAVTMLSRHSNGTDSAVAFVSYISGGFFFDASAINSNGTKEAQLSLNATQAALKYSPTGGGANYLKVLLDATGITFDGISVAGGLPTKCDQTQFQENADAIAGAGNLLITTNANTYKISPAAIITTITSTPAVGAIQVGTKITLEFTASGSIVSHDASSLLSDGIYLNGCVNFSPSVNDTLTLVLMERTPGGTKYWNEIGRKECVDVIGDLVDAVDILEACVLDASGGCYPESWKTLDASGTMLNGEAIPTLNPTASNIVSRRIRKLSKSHTELHIYATFSVADTIQIEAITTLPATALGISYRPTVDMNFPITGVLTGGAGVWSGYINISSGTGLVSVIVADPTFVTDTDVDVSFCIQIPTD